VSEVLLIINPAAGRGAAGRRWPELERRLRAAGLDFEAELTSRPGEGTEIARRAVKEGRSIVGAVGGDGTISEVANGFFENGEPIAGHTRLAALSVGTGGDFRRTFRLPKAPEEAAAMLLAGHSRRIDAGRVTFSRPGGGEVTRHFVNVADTGIGGEVLTRVNSGFRVLNGEITYAVAGAITLLRWRNRPMHVVVDGETHDVVAQQVVVANCEYFGGGMRVAPRAVPDDGLLDVVIAGDLSLIDSIRGMQRIRKGTHLDEGVPKIEHFHARRVEVSSPAPLHVDVDGELPGMLPAVFEAMPDALELICP
jgi:YegS/Rv2252/BmrU family lipid kinase